MATYTGWDHGTFESYAEDINDDSLNDSLPELTVEFLLPDLCGSQRLFGHGFQSGYLCSPGYDQTIGAPISHHRFLDCGIGRQRQI